MLIKEKSFQCLRCGGTFIAKARAAYYCPDCRNKHRSESVMKRRAAKDPTVKLGVGSGGNQWGEKNHQFKTGRSHYRNAFERDNPFQNFCEICGGSRHLVVHHIDGNRKNNAPENLVKICRSCHAQVHDLTRNFGGQSNECDPV